MHDILPPTSALLGAGGLSMRAWDVVGVTGLSVSSTVAVTALNSCSDEEASGTTLAGLAGALPLWSLASDDDFSRAALGTLAFSPIVDLQMSVYHDQYLLMKLVPEQHRALEFSFHGEAVFP